MNFAFIRSGAVVRYFKEIPFTFQGVSRFRNLTAEQQAALGIVPVVDITPAFDAEAFVRGGVFSVAVFSDRVEIVFSLVGLGSQRRAIEAGGRARTERQIRKLSESDPLEALLIKGGLK